MIKHLKALTAIALFGLAATGHSQPKQTSKPVDFLAEPKAACDWFAAQSLRAQLNWSKPGADGPYFCQFADQFSAATPNYVRAGRAILDTKTGEVSIGLSIQALGGEATRADAEAALVTFTLALYRAQGKTAPAEVLLMAGGKATAVVKLGSMVVTPADESVWKQHRVIGFTIEAPATAAAIAATQAPPSAAAQAATTGLAGALAARCDAAIKSSAFEGKPSIELSTYKRSEKQVAASQYVFEYTEPAGSAYSCRVCDDLDPKINCGFSFGALIAYGFADGKEGRVPAELDRKCVGALQKQLKNPDDKQFVDLALVARISAKEAHTEKSYVYQMSVKDESAEYRCVIRKRDLNYSVEQKRGDDWRGLVGGVMM